jgi:hypothetical protein
MKRLRDMGARGGGVVYLQHVKTLINPLAMLTVTVNVSKYL